MLDLSDLLCPICWRRLSHAGIDMSLIHQVFVTNQFTLTWCSQPVKTIVQHVATVTCHPLLGAIGKSWVSGGVQWWISCPEKDMTSSPSRGTAPTPICNTFTMKTQIFYKINKRQWNSFKALVIAWVVVNVCIQKHIHGQLDLEDTIQSSIFSFKALPGIHSKESLFLLAFSKDPLISSGNNSFHLNFDINEITKASMTLKL